MNDYLRTALVFVAACAGSFVGYWTFWVTIGRKYRLIPVSKWKRWTTRPLPVPRPVTPATLAALRTSTARHRAEPAAEPADRPFRGSLNIAMGDPRSATWVEAYGVSGQPDDLRYNRGE